MWPSNAYAVLDDVNLVAPLQHDDRCRVRFRDLYEALRTCGTTKACTGVVDDSGMWCGDEVLQFELRTGDSMVPLPGVHTWLRTAPWVAWTGWAVTFVLLLGIAFRKCAVRATHATRDMESML